MSKVISFRVEDELYTRLKNTRLPYREIGEPALSWWLDEYYNDKKCDVQKKFVKKYIINIRDTSKPIRLVFNEKFEDKYNRTREEVDVLLKKLKKKRQI